MEMKEIIESISKRGNGNIQLGVVGAVRTGKSTFIKKVIENLVVPYIQDDYDRKKCLDEIPQSSNGKQIMTTEPKFVPSSGATIKIDDFTTNIKLIDCVGYVIDESIGYVDSEGNPRLVNTPWYSESIPFVEAAEIGTNKVIKDHATIGIVITSDGSYGDFNRNDYIKAEEKVIEELKSHNKPFIIVLNTSDVDSSNTLSIKNEMESKYGVEVNVVNVESMGKLEINNLLRKAVDEFPVTDVLVNLPEWVHVLSNKHKVKKHYLEKIMMSVVDVQKIKDVDSIINYYQDSEYISKAYISEIDTGLGVVKINLDSSEEIYNEVLNELMGEETLTKAKMIKLFSSLNNEEDEISNLNEALGVCKGTGYGIVYPTINDMTLENPEIIKSGSRYGVKLKAKASSIHLIKVDELFEYYLNTYVFPGDSTTIETIMNFIEERGSIGDVIKGNLIIPGLTFFKDKSYIKVSDNILNIIAASKSSPAYALYGEMFDMLDSIASGLISNYNFITNEIIDYIYFSDDCLEFGSYWYITNTAFNKYYVVTPVIDTVEQTPILFHIYSNYIESDSTTHANYVTATQLISGMEIVLESNNKDELRNTINSINTKLNIDKPVNDTMFTTSGTYSNYYTSVINGNNIKITFVLE